MISDVEVLKKIALIVHYGGWAFLSEGEALTLVRKLTIKHFNPDASKETVTEAIHKLIKN